jgi:hypothetical protein
MEHTACRRVRKDAGNHPQKGHCGRIVPQFCVFEAIHESLPIVKHSLSFFWFLFLFS